MRVVKVKPKDDSRLEAVIHLPAPTLRKEVSRKMIPVLSKAALVLGLVLVPSHTAKDANHTIKQHPSHVSLKRIVSRVLHRHWFMHMRTGQASWYGPGFQGRTTAYGKIFNTYLPMCAMMHVFERNAHTGTFRTMVHVPKHTWVTVRNLDNGKEAKCQIEDTGAFEPLGRIIDLSWAIKSAIGMKDTGRVAVYY